MTWKRVLGTKQKKKAQKLHALSEKEFLNTLNDKISKSVVVQIHHMNECPIHSIQK
jgi:hypothetical protein